MALATIAHISDLHFPLTEETVIHQLLRELHEARPQLVVISGDLTQRGRESQYRLAADFVGSLPRPILVVPGNHDVPLYNLYRRFFRPLDHFRRYISDELCPVYRHEQMIVVGANSTRALTMDPYGFWKNGTLSDEQLRDIGLAFADAPADALRVLVMHHPLINPSGRGSRDTARRRDHILRALEQFRVDVVLSGHLHRAYGRHAPTTPDAARGILCIQSGTSCSTRFRDELNAFNFIDWDRHELTVRTMRFGNGRFSLESANRFLLREASPSAIGNPQSP